MPKRTVPRSTIISIRGTNGSGKSTIARKLIELFDAQPESVDKRGKPQNYVMTAGQSTLHIIGSYANDCGGCDGIKVWDDIWPRVVRFAELGHVVFEGLSVSSGYGRIGKWSEPYGDRMIFAFMDTPPELCIERVIERRKRKGNLKPYDATNLLAKHRAVQSTLRRCRDEFGRRAVILNHLDPVSQVLDLLKINQQKTLKVL
jgi:hypothetical protein